MATSGSKTIAVTSWDDLVFSWSVTSQSITNNTSTVAWSLKLVAGSSGRISSSANKVCSVTVNGETYTGMVQIAIANNATKTLLSGTTVIKHNDGGTKTFSYSFSQEFAITFSDTYIGTKTGNSTGTLDTIKRLSTMSITGGLLGSSHTIAVTRYDSNFTHTISYKCGSVTGNVCTKSTQTSVSFTPPISLASTNTTGTTVSVTYTISTESGNTSYGTTSVTVTHTMPVSVKPSCSVSVSDAAGHYATYGAYVKGLSKFAVTVTATPSYGAAITSYSTTANGATYTAASFTTAVLKASGSLSVSATVKDARGRTGTGTASLTVLDYVAPSITKLTVHRCDADGTENEQGEYVKATFSAAVTNLNSKNPATYTLKYKKAIDTTYTSIALSNLDNVYAVTDSTHIFAADSDKSYDVVLEVTDNHSTTKRATSASTAFTLIHFRSDGTGIAFGKLSENEKQVDFGIPVRLSDGLVIPCLEPETDLNNVIKPGTYTGENVTTYNYANCPVSNGTFTLLVESGGEDGQVKQTFIACSKYKPERYSRFYYQGEWGDWFWASTDEVVLYENASGSTDTITLLNSASHYRYLEIYYTDNNGKSGGYTKVWKPDGKTVCLHIQEAGTTVYSRQTIYIIGGTTMKPTLAGFLKFTGSMFTTTSGTNYIKIVRVVGRA